MKHRVGLAHCASTSLLVLWLAGCGSDTPNASGAAGATVSSGGSVSTGGATTDTGGTTGQGGVTGQGGAVGGDSFAGGAAAGGATGQGGGAVAGNTSTGGAAPGGATGKGGASGKGGTAGANSATGGGAATGGATSIGGATAQAGSSGNGGTVAGGLRWVGRVDATNPNAAKFAWQGAGFVAVVSGATIAVKLRTEGTTTVFFQPVVDGTVGARFKIDKGSDQTVTLGTGLSAADHVVELYRETEGMYGLSTFLGFTSGTVKGAPAASGRLIEVVGDSISAGYGNLGSEPHPNWVASPACHWTADNSSWYATYAAVAGHALNAEVSTIACSGWGMYRDNQNGTTSVLSSVYENALGTGSTSAWSFTSKASVAVVNLGTNDWANGDPGTPYEKAYVNFIAKVRSHYPEAWIFLTIGSMTGEPELTQVKTRLNSVIASVTAATGDKKLATFDFGTQNTGTDGTVPTGCDWHPNAADHKRMAGILQQQLKDKLGW